MFGRGIFSRHNKEVIQEKRNYGIMGKIVWWIIVMVTAYILIGYWF